MCGIFGQSTNNPKKINQANIKILGLFNETRGKHSCGISYDGEIYHGLDKEKLFTDFIKGRIFKTEKYPIVIGHTRSASSGTVNQFNSHPFGFGENKDKGFEFIGVHNGTLYNHVALAKDFGIDEKSSYIGEHSKLEIPRTKIDSEILLEILSQNKDNYDVLMHYNGKAALVWTDTNEPNVIYLWSGKSRMTEHHVSGPQLEERPMNVWVESKNNFYFSSLPEALHVIGGTSETVKQIEYNTVYKITNGDFENAKLTSVSRDDSFQNETYIAKNYTSSRHGYLGKDLDVEEADDCNWDGGRIIYPVSKSTTTVEDFLKRRNISSTSEDKKLNIYEDKALKSPFEYGNKMYVEKLRYYKKGALVSGICVYIANYGFHYLGEDIIQSQKVFEDLKGKYFSYDTGTFHSFSTSKTDVIVFDNALTSPFYYYFLHGARLKTCLDYTVCLASRVALFSDHERLSYVTTHPIASVNYTFKPDNKQEILLEGKNYTGEITGLSFEKVYIVNNGNLVSISTKNNRERFKEMKEKKSKEENIFNPNVLSEARMNLLQIENNIIKEEQYNEEVAKNLEKTEAESDKLLEIVTELLDVELTPQLASWQNCREELLKLDGNNEHVISAKLLIHDLIETVNNFINIKNE